MSDPTERQSRIWSAIARLVASPYGVLVAFVWGFAEALLGVLTTAALASRGVPLPAPLTTSRMAATAFDQLAAGPSAIMHQALSGIPVKVYARAAGEHHIDLWHLVGWTLLERGLRISMVGLVVWLLASLLHPVLQRRYGVYLIIAVVVFTGALSAVIAAWS
jgi:hypothetical protein